MKILIYKSKMVGTIEVLVIGTKYHCKLSDSNRTIIRQSKKEFDDYIKKIDAKYLGEDEIPV